MRRGPKALGGWTGHDHRAELGELKLLRSEAIKNNILIIQLEGEVRDTETAHGQYMESALKTATHRAQNPL